MSDINLIIPSDSSVVDLSISTSTNVVNTVVESQNSISIDPTLSVTPTSLLDLTDVNASTISNGQVLTYNASSGKFVSGSAGDTYTIGSVAGDDAASEKIRLTSSSGATSDMLIKVSDNIDVRQGTTGSDTHIQIEGGLSSISAVDGDNSDEEKIRHTNTKSGGTSDVVIEAGTGLSIARSDNKITLTNTVSDSDTNTTYSVSCVDGDNGDEEKIRLTDSSGGTDDVVLEAGTGLTIARSGDKITFTNSVSDNNTTYTVSCVDGDNADEEKIRLTGSDSSTDDVVLEAAGSLTIARSSDKITFTNDRFNTRLKGDHFPCSNDSAASSFGHIDISADYWYGGVFRVEGQMNITHIGIQTKNGTNTAHDIVCGIYKYVYSSDSWTKVVQVGPFTTGVDERQAIALASTETLAQGLYMSVLLADGAQQDMGGNYVADTQALVPMATANARGGFYLFDNSYTYTATLPSTVASGALSVWEYNGHKLPSAFFVLG